MSDSESFVTAALAQDVLLGAKVGSLVRVDSHDVRAPKSASENPSLVILEASIVGDPVPVIGDPTDYWDGRPLPGRVHQPPSVQELLARASKLGDDGDGDGLRSVRDFDSLSEELAKFRETAATEFALRLEGIRQEASEHLARERDRSARLEARVDRVLEHRELGQLARTLDPRV